MDKTEALRQCPLFKGFTKVGLRIIASIAQEKHLESGTTIFMEGTDAESMFVVQAGEVGVFLDNDDQERSELARMGPHQSFGELALLTSGGRRLASTRALTDVVLLEIQSKDFARLQSKKPQACLKLLMAIVRDLGDRLSEGRDSLKSALA